ncbi:CLUMA_CG017424, isoform A [Clunio marinus]|uniref:CLUMA_CG017424, isoform A n=1 Tax=Clunio marinus TaxID=568069 RepID=A0A1J1IX99_9DIPT|nr:CLUMA_CG017424, isoform A [Clunio marinus]
MILNGINEDKRKVVLLVNLIGITALVIVHTLGSSDNLLNVNSFLCTVFNLINFSALIDLKYNCTDFHHLSDNIKKQLCRNNEELKIAFKPINKINKYFTKLKDKVGEEEQTNVIYEIKCECGRSYVENPEDEPIRCSKLVEK